MDTIYLLPGEERCVDFRDRHHIKHFLSVRPYYKGIDYYVARMSSIICTPAVLQLREFL